MGVPIRVLVRVPSALTGDVRIRLCGGIPPVAVAFSSEIFTKRRGAGMVKVAVVFPLALVSILLSGTLLRGRGVLLSCCVFALQGIGSQIFLREVRSGTGCVPSAGLLHKAREKC